LTEPGPEHEAKHRTTEWLQDHGASVYWEEANAWGHQKFTIERQGHGGIPDLVIEIDDKTFVVEFKTGSSVGEIYDALTQLHGYWREHVETDQTIICDGQEVEIDAFLTASKHSRYGRLFPSYAETLQTPEEMSDSRATVTRMGQLPPREYRMTEQHIRTLWRLAKETDASAVTEPPALGALLSSQLEREQINPQPAVLVNQGPTNQNWEVLN
jgi:hypothetical protein